MNLMKSIRILLLTPALSPAFCSIHAQSVAYQLNTHIFDISKGEPAPGVEGTGHYQIPIPMSANGYSAQKRSHYSLVPKIINNIVTGYRNYRLYLWRLNQQRYDCKR